MVFQVAGRIGVGNGGSAGRGACFHLTSWAGKPGRPSRLGHARQPRRQSRASFAPVVKKAAPSVVNIYSTHIVHERLMRHPLLNDPVFRHFFGGQIPNDDRERTRREGSLGSGSIISRMATSSPQPRGGWADEIKVRLADDKKEYTRPVIGTDPRTDCGGFED